MSIHIGKHNIDAISVGRKAIVLVYRGKRLIWEGIRSCFGRGLWMNEKPWLNSDGWKNNV